MCPECPQLFLYYYGIYGILRSCQHKIIDQLILHYNTLKIKNKI